MSDAIPSQPQPTADLSDSDFDTLDALLAQTPPPLQPLDAVMLDGYLCGVLVQPVLLTPGDWLPPIFDFDGQPLPDTVDADWKERVTALVLRRHAALNRAMAEDGWFDPLVLELDGEDGNAGSGDAAFASAGQDAEAPAPDGAEDDVLASLPPWSRPLMPWVAGFEHAVHCFAALSELQDDGVQLALARLYRHLPAQTPEERELVATLDREQPLASLDEAVEELVLTVADLWDLTRAARYRVDTVRRETPKVGRNDPCPCGSGKKYKQCHGA